LKEIGRIDTLVRELLDYAAPSRSASELLDPLSVLNEARQIVGHQGLLASHSVEASRLPERLPEVRVVRHKLLQVFVNLLLNALDASGKEGQLTFAGGSSGSEVWLSIADQGSGIPGAVLDQIFEPFFSTKPPGKGRGLGLSVCQRVVEEAGGRIEVRSEVGQGSEFTIYLPKAEHLHEA
jgi:signal transduction histidine kinase